LETPWWLPRTWWVTLPSSFSWSRHKFVLASSLFIDLPIHNILLNLNWTFCVWLVLSSVLCECYSCFPIWLQSFYIWKIYQSPVL
jgi:hypothetical protein